MDKKSTRQDLQYTYDPRGNITHIDDKAQPDIDRVSASKDYTYDPINRLIESSGRKDIANEQGKHLLVRNTEGYSYDSSGNILSIQTCHADRRYPGRTKTYHYNDAMSFEKGKFTNRLSEIEVGRETESFTYDAHGNVISMAGFSVLEWDFQNQLRQTSRQVIEGKMPETAYYVYGADGNRVRKVTERKADPDQQPARLYDTLYLGGLEIFRKYPGNGSIQSLQRRTTSIGSETPTRRVETQRWQASGEVTDTPIFRYQLPDHLGSVGLELDEVGRILSQLQYYHRSQQTPPPEHPTLHDIYIHLTPIPAITDWYHHAQRVLESSPGVGGLYQPGCGSDAPGAVFRPRRTVPGRGGRPPRNIPAQYSRFEIPHLETLPLHLVTCAIRHTFESVPTPTQKTDDYLLSVSMQVFLVAHSLGLCLPGRYPFRPRGPNPYGV